MAIPDLSRNQATVILAKIDEALRLIREGQKERVVPNVELAVAALESARRDLLGQKQS